MKETTKLILQARLGSSRLPHKVLLPFYKNESILEIVLKKLISRLGIDSIVVATTTSSDDDKIVELCNNLNCKVYRGSEHDVLERFINASIFFKVEKIIRICSDNPFIDLNFLEKLIQFHEESNFEYTAFELSDNLPTIKTHIGLFAEGTSLKALQKIKSYTNDKLYLEHVTNYLYSNPQLFDVNLLQLPSYISGRNDIRLTVDTKEDFETCKKIYEDLIMTSNLDLETLINYISSNEEILTNMKKQIEKNGK